MMIYFKFSVKTGQLTDVQLSYKDRKYSHFEVLYDEKRVVWRGD